MKKTTTAKFVYKSSEKETTNTINSAANNPYLNIKNSNLDSDGAPGSALPAVD